MEELFDTSKYSASAPIYDFEFEQLSSKKKGSARFIVDPAWDDGSAFPGISSLDSPFKVGEQLRCTVGERLRLKHTNRVGIVLHISSSGMGRLKWEGEEEPDERKYDLCDTYFEKCPVLDTNDDDRWNPAHFGSDPSFKANDEQLTIFYDDSLEPPEPDDFKTIAEYEEAWEKWISYNSLTCAQESVSVSHSPGCNSDLNLSESRKSTVTAQTSSANDIQESLTTEMSGSSQSPAALEQGELTQLPRRRLVNRSASREDDREQPTSETVSPQSSKSSRDVNQDFSASKTLRDCSAVDISQELSNPTLDFYSTSFPAAGMMSSGSLYLVEPLALPSLEKDCLWLESPNALSSVGRSPGLSKLESSLIKQGVLERGQVINPSFLEESFGIPLGWTDPLELRPATQLLEDAEQPSEMHLTLESPALPSGESCTCSQSLSESTPEKFLEETEEDEPQRCKGAQCPKGQSPSGESCTYSQSPSESIPEKFLEEKKKRNRKGCLYKYLENKKLKDGTIASYPRVIGERDLDNPKHWRWGFNWEEKIDGEWKGRSIGSVPVGAIPMIQSMQKLGVPLEEIINFIRRSKAKK